MTDQLPGKAASQDVPSTSASSSSTKNTDSQPTSTETSSFKKRSSAEMADSPLPFQPLTPEDEGRAVKRRRDTAQENHPPTVSYVPPQSWETEDISEEVQRRLRIKEEKRRKRENTKPEKRKRESLQPDELPSRSEEHHRKKRARRTSSDLKRAAESFADKPAEGKTKRLKQMRSGT